MAKNISGILALIVGVVTFSIWYKITLDTYPSTPKYAMRIFYYGYYLTASLTFFALTANSKNKIKQLIYYAGCNFYLFLAITYALNYFFDILIRQNKIIATLILTVSSCIIFYLFSARSQSEK